MSFERKDCGSAVDGFVDRTLTDRTLTNCTLTDRTLTDRVKLPQPDLKNITVLTRNLPNSPILPWNHYDSPWLQAEAVDRAR